MLHRFWAGCETGTDVLEANILQQLTDMRGAVLYEVFMDLQKAYDALDWDRCLKILAEYGVGPRVIRLLWTYWVRLTMVASTGGYYDPPLKGYHGVTQEDPLTTTLFKMVMDSVIRHWVMVVAATMEGKEGLGLLIRNLEAYLYAEDGLVASTQEDRL